MKEKNVQWELLQVHTIIIYDWKRTTGMTIGTTEFAAQHQLSGRVKL